MEWSYRAPTCGLAMCSHRDGHRKATAALMTYEANVKVHFAWLLAEAMQLRYGPMLRVW